MNEGLSAGSSRQAQLVSMKKLAYAALALATPAIAHNSVSHDPNLPAPTKAQIHEVADAVARYQDFEVARREGWVKFGGDEPLMGEHWHLDKDGPDYIDNQPLDFSRPSNLMYTDIGGRRVLTGVAFIVRIAPGDPVPDGFYGGADHWHVHDFEHAVEAALVDRPILRWLVNGWIDKNYRQKGDNRGRVAMVHAWVTLPNPDGVFANYNRTIPYLKLGLPVDYANGASTEAAQGLNLASKAGCVDAIDGRVWIANLSRATSKALHASCDAESAAIRTKLKASAAEINDVAAQGWARFDAQWAKLLTLQQRDRIAAMNEHGDGDGHDMSKMSDMAMPGHEHH